MPSTRTRAAFAAGREAGVSPGYTTLATDAASTAASAPPTRVVLRVVTLTAPSLATGASLRNGPPPRVGSGFLGMTDEKMDAFGGADSWVYDQLPQASIKELAPTMPADIFADYNQIRELMLEASGLTATAEGKGTKDAALPAALIVPAAPFVSLIEIRLQALEEDNRLCSFTSVCETVEGHLL